MTTGKQQPGTLERRDASPDGRRFSPSAGRNKAAIFEAFRELMFRSGRVLEIGSGTGEHGVEITAGAPGLSWVFSDPDPAARKSISAWITHEAKLSGRDLSGPFAVDVTDPSWCEAFAGQHFDGLVSINMIHIAPIAALHGLMAGAGALLDQGGKLFIYGPFARKGEMAESNLAFDQFLKDRDTRWGVRDLDEEVVLQAEKNDLALKIIRDMPANNLSLVFEKSA